MPIGPCLKVRAPSHEVVERLGTLEQHADHYLDYEGVPNDVCAILAWELRLERYIRECKAGLILGPANHRHESTAPALRYLSRRNGQQVPVDDQGWRLTKNGRRDLRYKGSIGLPLT